MGVTRLPNETPPDSRQFTMNLQETAKPLVVAGREFYKTNPKDFLELVLTGLLIFLTFLGELVRPLPWGWYLMVITLGLRPALPYVIKKLKRNARSKLPKPKRIQN